MFVEVGLLKVIHPFSKATYDILNVFQVSVQAI